MTDKTISALTAASVPLSGTEVLPVVQSGSTKKVAVSDLTADRAVSMSSATTGSSSQTTSNTVNFAYGGSSNDYGVQNRYYSGSTLTTTVGHDKSIFGGSSSDYAIYATTGNGIRIYTNGANLAWHFDTNQNLVQKTAAKGINFTANTPAAGKTSQLLNWYEEGVWTPTDVSGAAPALSFTVTDNKYTRIGRVVHCSALVTYPTTTDGSNAQIGGFPFTCGAYASAYLPIFYNVEGGAITLAATTSAAYLRNNLGNVYTNSNLSTKTIAINITYQV